MSIKPTILKLEIKNGPVITPQGPWPEPPAEVPNMLTMVDGTQIPIPPDCLFSAGPMSDGSQIIVPPFIMPIATRVHTIEYWPSSDPDGPGVYVITGLPVTGVDEEQQAMCSYAEINEDDVEQVHYGVTAAQLTAFVAQQRRLFAERSQRRADEDDENNDGSVPPARTKDFRVGIEGLNGGPAGELGDGFASLHGLSLG